MSKMHELLAVEPSVVGNYNRDYQETLKVFERADLFTRTVTRKEFFDAAQAEKLNTTETKEITTTVPERLEWTSNAISSLFDFVLQKDKTNQQAKADIVIEGVGTLAKEVPATTLLMLETKLGDVRKIFEAIPVLPPGIKWEKDETEKNLYRSSEPQVSFSTKKTTKPVVLAEATKEHPAQVKEVAEDIAIAKISKDTYLGMLTSADKAVLLGRLDQLLQACKTARMRANDIQASRDKFGGALVGFLYGGTVQSST